MSKLEKEENTTYGVGDKMYISTSWFKGRKLHGLMVSEDIFSSFTGVFIDDRCRNGLLISINNLRLEDLYEIRL